MKKKEFLQIKKYPFSSSKELMNEYKKKKIIASLWIEKFIKRNKTNMKKSLFPCKLYRINLRKDLGIKKPTYLKDIYKEIKRMGYNLVEPEVAIYARLLI